MQKYIILVLIILCCIFFGLYQYQKSLKEDIAFIDAPLPEKVQAQIVVDNNKIKVKNKKVLKNGEEKTSVQIIEAIPEAKTEIQVKEDGSVKIKQATWGFVLKPGIDVFYAKNAGIGVCSRLFYCHQFGVFLSLGIDFDKCLNINGGVDYRLTKWNMRNVAVGIGLNNKNYVSIGLHIYLD